MTRSAISPRFAMRTLLNITGEAERGTRRASSRDLALESGPRCVAGACHALHPECKLGRAGRVEDGALVGNLAARVQLHERLIEALHAVLHRAFLDEIGNVERLFHVADVVAHRGG